MLQKHSLTLVSLEKHTIFHLNFKFVKFDIEEDVIFLGIFYAVIDVCF